MTPKDLENIPVLHSLQIEALQQQIQTGAITEESGNALITKAALSTLADLLETELKQN